MFHFCIFYVSFDEYINFDKLAILLVNYFVRKLLANQVVLSKIINLFMADENVKKLRDNNLIFKIVIYSSVIL